MKPDINFFGIIHQSGGCGLELLGAIELLQQKRGLSIRCIVPSGDPVVRGRRASFLASRSVEVVEYRPGMFSKCDVLVSFGEHKCFEYMRSYGDRPRKMVWSSGMSWAVDDEVLAYSEGLIDEFFFQSPGVARDVSRDIGGRTGKAIPFRNNYCPFIKWDSPYGQYTKFIDKPLYEFRVCKAVRDDPDKWHTDTWRMLCGLTAPAGKSVKIEVAGWGQNALKKIGSPTDPSSKWHGLFDLALYSHVVDPKWMAQLYGRSHVLLHYYPFVESFGFATIQAMLAGAVPVAADEGGFSFVIENGKTGFLAKSPDEAAYYTSKLAFEPDLWRKMSVAANDWVVRKGPGNPEKCWPWWNELVPKKRGRVLKRYEAKRSKSKR